VPSAQSQYSSLTWDDAIVFDLSRHVNPVVSGAYMGSIEAGTPRVAEASAQASALTRRETLILYCYYKRGKVLSVYIRRPVTVFHQTS
jgi:hypothetical protein